MRILVLDDNRDYAENLAEIVETLDAAREIEIAFNLAEGLARLESFAPHLTIVDLDLPDGQGGDFVRAARQMEEGPLCLILTGAGTMRSAVELVEAGAFGFLTKDLPVQAILASAQRAIDHLEAKAESEALRRRLAEKEHLAAIGQMAATLAHEIKNPLTGISTALDVLLSSIDPPAELSALHAGIRSRFRDLDLLVNDLLAFARPFVPEWRDFAPETLIEALERGLEPQCAEGAEFRSEVEPGLHTLRGDSVWLEAALSNLLRNGLDAGAECGRARVRLRLRRDGDALVFEVEDEGRGVEESQVESIFEPFFTTKTRGSGLGLAVTRRIAREHGGDVRYEAIPGGGSRFVMRIPQETSQS
jgi:signal transduction histidine kinase